MKIQIMTNAKKKRFISELSGFGLKKVGEMLVRTGKERIRAFSGSLDREEVMALWRLMPIEGIGLYVGKEFVNWSGVREVRLSVDGVHVWKKQLKDGIFVLTEEQEEKWFLGEDIQLGGRGEWVCGSKDIDGGFVLVKSADGKDFVGCGKLSGGVLYNYLPKERRRRSSVV